MESFTEAVYRVLRQIPRGKVTTYADIARAIGRPRAARAVGNALKKNPCLVKVPCHRVIKSNGELGGYARGTKRKRELLKEEGTKICNNKIDLGEYKV